MKMRLTGVIRVGCLILRSILLGGLVAWVLTTIPCATGSVHEACGFGKPRPLPGSSAKRPINFAILGAFRSSTFPLRPWMRRPSAAWSTAQRTGSEATTSGTLCGC